MFYNFALLNVNISDILYFIFVLGIVIFVHELGHFLLARKVGIKVEKFSLGMGPKIFGFRKGDTEYILSSLPVGGYVKMSGENLEEEETETEKQKEIPLEESKQKFYNKTVLQRAMVVSAGPLMNIFLAILIFTFVFMIGVPLISNKVGDIIKNSPAESASILPGDRIVAIDDTEVELWDDITKIIHANPGKTLKLTIERGNEKISKTIVPRNEKIINIFNEEVEIGIIGISIGDKPDYIIKKYNPFQSFSFALKQVYNITKNTFIGLAMMLRRKIEADVAGPIGIFQLTSEQARAGFRNLWTFIAVLSINLGIMNLLPFPVLDGGHLFFLLIEKIKGSPIKIKYREIAQQIGALILIILVIVITYKDIIRSMR